MVVRAHGPVLSVTAVALTTPVDDRTSEKAASREARNATAAAMSSGSPARPSGYTRAAESRSASRPSHAEVRTVPGATRLTRPPRGAACPARVRVSDISPALAAPQYAGALPAQPPGGGRADAAPRP